jgi:vacuolar-type H+-ATPase subunit E/Vma4
MKDQEPDFTGSTTGASECWKNPLYPMHERLEMADGAIGYRDRIIKQLRARLEAREVLEVAHAEMLKEIHAMGAEKLRAMHEANRDGDIAHALRELSRGDHEV